MRYLRLDAETALPDLSRHSPFKTVLVAESPLDGETRAAVARWLVEAGCRYMVACGDGCESWCESVRRANLDAFGAENIQSPDFVMITSHPHESLRSVFWYAKKAAKHPDHQFQETVVLHVSQTDRSVKYAGLFQRA